MRHGSHGLAAKRAQSYVKYNINYIYIKCNIYDIFTRLYLWQQGLWHQYLWQQYFLRTYMQHFFVPTYNMTSISETHLMFIPHYLSARCEVFDIKIFDNKVFDIKIFDNKVLDIKIFDNRVFDINIISCSFLIVCQCGVRRQPPADCLLNKHYAETPKIRGHRN